MRAPSSRVLVALALLSSATVFAEAQTDRFSAGGYFRIMTRPDFQGGSSKLGFWNLYGRLLNEGPWGALELKLDVLKPNPGTQDVWASIHTKIEGGSFANADPQNGALDAFRVTQMYVKAGNILFDRVTWQLGTLDTYFGDLGLYDVKPAQIFYETIGLSARYNTDRVELLVGVGDSGYFMRRDRYNTLFTAGGTVRLRLGDHLELGAGGVGYYEPHIEGNQFSPYSSHLDPRIGYEDYVRKEVMLRYFQLNPLASKDILPLPEANSATSYKVVGYLGFGKLGPLRWNNFFINYLRKHPDPPYHESAGGLDYTVYVTDLTDDRYELNAGNEMQLTIIPDRLDIIWGVLFGHHVNRDNAVKPGDDNRTFYSTVLRAQLYLTKTVHFLAESSLAHEESNLACGADGSRPCNQYREHADSLFENTAGVPDSRGFEFGDASARNTWQLKTGFVLNPTGFGIYTRPSLRLLYGLQYSNQQAAFGNGFVENQSQYNIFKTPELHWHHVVAVEAEAWF